MNQINNFFTSGAQLLTLPQNVTTVSDGVTMIPLNQITVSILAGEEARIDGFLVYKTGNNEGIKIEVNADKELAYNYIVFGCQSDTQSFSLEGVFGIPEPAVFIDDSNNGEKDKAARFTLTLKGGNENSTITISFSQWQVGNKPTTVKAGSCLQVTKG